MTKVVNFAFEMQIYQPKIDIAIKNSNQVDVENLFYYKKLHSIYFVQSSTLFQSTFKKSNLLRS